MRIITVTAVIGLLLGLAATPAVAQGKKAPITVHGGATLVTDYRFRDLIAGVKHSFGATTIDAGVLYYYYPGSGGVASDFVEPYASITQAVGPASIKGSIAYAPRQNALSVGNGREDNLYLAGDVSLAVPDSPISLTGHLGHSKGPSFITIGRSTTDWSLGASAAWRGLTLGVAYVDTDATAFSPRGRQIAGSGIVASLGASF
jgi:uncharacterized protein (TIGR02001 family)